MYSRAEQASRRLQTSLRPRCGIARLTIRFLNVHVSPVNAKLTSPSFFIRFSALLCWLLSEGSYLSERWRALAHCCRPFAFGEEAMRELTTDKWRLPIVRHVAVVFIFCESGAPPVLYKWADRLAAAAAVNEWIRLRLTTAARTLIHAADATCKLATVALR